LLAQTPEPVTHLVSLDGSPFDGVDQAADLPLRLSGVEPGTGGGRLGLVVGTGDLVDDSLAVVGCEQLRQPVIVGEGEGPLGDEQAWRVAVTAGCGRGCGIGSRGGRGHG
jgi:hypothetical protein